MTVNHPQEDSETEEQPSAQWRNLTQMPPTLLETLYFFALASLGRVVKGQLVLTRIINLKRLSLSVVLLQLPSHMFSFNSSVYFFFK